MRRCVIFLACMWRAPGLISDSHASFGLGCFHVSDLLCVPDATHCTRLSNNVFNCKAETHCCDSVKLFLCPSQSSQYVQCVAGCLQLMLKVNEYRFAWVEADGVNWWVMISCFHSSDQMKSDLEGVKWKASCKVVSFNYLVQNLFEADSYCGDIGRFSSPTSPVPPLSCIHIT